MWPLGLAEPGGPDPRFYQFRSEKGGIERAFFLLKLEIIQIKTKNTKIQERRNRVESIRRLEGVESKQTGQFTSRKTNSSVLTKRKGRC